MPNSDDVDTPHLSNQLCFALYATSRAFTKIYAQLLKDMGVTYPQYLVLLILWEKGDLTVQKIADELEIESATATPLIKRMEKLGLVTRTRSTEDERRVVVRQTQRADRFREQAKSIPHQLGCAVNVTESQALKLLNELNTIRENIE